MKLTEWLDRRVPYWQGPVALAVAGLLLAIVVAGLCWFSSEVSW